ncbi:MAG: translation initiation factor IF-2 N-terminal domain-containing protein, partial [Janthinobacterium lividum]
MSKVRINDLARELEVKSRPILDALEAIGVSGKTHSSSIEEDQAEKVRGYFRGDRSNTTARANSSPSAPPKFNLSNASKPGDAMRAIRERQQAQEAARNAPPARPVSVPPAVVAPPVRP